MSVPNCFQPLEGTDSKTKCLIATSTLLFPGEHHMTVHSEQYFPTPGNLRDPQVPCKTLVFHQRGRFFQTNETIQFPWQKRKARSCPVHHILYHGGQRYYPGQAGGLSQPCWSAWNFGHQSSTMKVQALYGTTHTLSILQRVCLDWELGCLLLPNVCLSCLRAYQGPQAPGSAGPSPGTGHPQSRRQGHSALPKHTTACPQPREAAAPGRSQGRSCEVASKQAGQAMQLQIRCCVAHWILPQLQQAGV